MLTDAAHLSRSRGGSVQSFRVNSSPDNVVDERLMFVCLVLLMEESLISLLVFATDQ